MRIFLAGSLLLFSVASFGQAKRALSLIEKQKYETAFDLLSNGLAKDTTSASIPFVLAKLYLEQDWPQNQLDSAFYFSERSLYKYDLLDEKHLDKHIKDGFGKTRLLTLKKHIDKLAFEVAKQRGTEIDYQEFIDRHTDAAELDSAIYLRNEQAYITASRINTLTSYNQFLDKYPNAVDWEKADATYQRILYVESTESGKLKAYKAFVKEHPKSPYREEAINHIYTIEVGRNSIKSILGFVTEYPKSRASVKAIGLLYHKHLAQERASSFADKYPKIIINDSLKQVIKNQEKTVLPVWNGNHFQIVDLSQRTIIDSLVLVDKNTINKDFLAVKSQGRDALVSKTGEVFYKSNTFSFVGEEQGFVFLREKDRTIIVHKNGGVIDGREEANLQGAFISYKNKGQWGLKSVTNLNLLAPQYDSIWAEQSLLFLSSKDKICIVLPKTLYAALDGQPVDVGIGFDEYEWLTDSLLWVESGGKEGLFSEQLEELAPLGKHQIDIAKKGWSIVKKGVVSIPAFSDQSLTQFNENDEWQIGYVKDSLIVKHHYNQLFSPTSASLLGSSAIIMHWADSGYVYLTDTLKFFKPTDYEVKPLLNQDNKVYYYEVIEGKKKRLMNSLGQKLDLPNYKKIIPLNESFFQLETSKAKQLYTSSGELILDKIEGAALIDDSTISILKDQQFGLIQPYDSIYIEPIYSRKLSALADSLWVVSDGNNYGVINPKSDTLLPFSYDEINYWINGLLFVKSDLKWNIYDLKTSKFVESGIVSYSSITRNGNPKITFQKGVGIGVFDSEKGLVLKPTFTVINLEGTTEEPYYRAEKYVEEAGLHIMLYYDMAGKQLFQNILNEAAFSLLYGTSEE